MADIHNYRKRLERTLENIKKSDISDVNKKHLLSFHDSCFSEGLSICKTERYLYDLLRLAKVIRKDLNKATREDLLKIVADIEKGSWSCHTKHTFKVTLKKFYRWIEGIDERGVYPKKVRWIKTGVKTSNQMLPGDLLTVEDIENMISSAQKPRDRALVSVLYESGCRIGEIGKLRFKEISFDDYGAKLTVSGKTGSRVVRIVNSAPYLREWMNKHPENKKPDSYIWINAYTHEMLSYTRMVELLKRMGRNAGINKRIYPHLFRHSRATYLASRLTEAQMKSYLGWTQGSKMAGVYVHMSGRDTENAILAISGVEIEKDKEDKRLQKKICIRCKEEHESAALFCRRCGMPLDKKDAEEIIKTESERNEADEIMNKLLNDPEVLELIKKKLS